MLFSSLTFIFIFLPIVILLYFISNKTYKNIVLLISSLLFYAWGEPKYVILMILSIVVNYFLAILIDKYRTNKKVSTLILILDLIINLGLLVFFKYTNFIITNINNLLNANITFLNIVMPIGISFYTFQILSYVIDVYRNNVKVQNNILLLGTYVVLFPQLVAGPIVRYETVENELNFRKHTFDNVIIGIRRFIIGLGKKVILANNVAIIADQLLSSSSLYAYGSIVVWIGIISYTLQIYFDFSGYSDMAIGLGKIFGFTFLENFNYPYMSKSITDFWRRWHMSLSSWFRDYVYIPLGGNRVGKIRWIFNIMVVWMLTGLWHGASWNFVIWGLYFGIILLIEKLFLKKYLDKLPIPLQLLYSLILIITGWAIFRTEDISIMTLIIKKMFIFSRTDIGLFVRNNYELFNYLIYFIVAIVCSTPLIGNLFKKMERKGNLQLLLLNTICLCIFILSVCFLVKSTYNPFIYFRF